MPARWLLPLYATALFLGALLLFGVQPMVTKMVLPRLGGSPAVWNTAQVFFQVVLLAGYAWAHLLGRLRDRRVQVGVHLMLLLAVFALLPIAVPAGWDPPVDASPAPWLLGLLGVSVGLPFFGVATTAPLLQSWFARTVHADAADPYFLYSASNLGGLVALLGYPFLLEPHIGLAGQGVLWGWSYAALAALVAVAGLLPARALPGTGAAPARAPAATTGWGVRARWLALAFAPSSLMLGVTLHISTDVAASPILWVVPLALYLLSFIVAFARRPVLAHRAMVGAQAFAVALLAVWFEPGSLVAGFVLHLGAFFLCAMVCHGELARARPPVERLTEFYLCIAVGGVLGGAFSALLAPAIFDSVLEYPIALVLACALRPSAAAAAAGARERVRDVVLPVGVGALYLLGRFELDRHAGAPPWMAVALALAVALAVVALRRRSVRFALAVALLLAVDHFGPGSGNILAEKRSFFGVHRVVADSSGNYNLLINGGTVHGAEARDRRHFRDPLTYYVAQGPAGQVFAALRARRPDAHVGAIGLGSGAITCYLGRHQTLTYFEVDPVVVRLASEPRYFLYLAGCGHDVHITVGDGRRRLRAAHGVRFDLIVLDAFSSDAVPAHLLTRGAMKLYRRHLAPGGALLVHVSNRYLDLAPVVGAVAADAGMVARVQRYRPAPAYANRPYHWPSTWILVARRDADLEPYTRAGDWRPLVADGATRAWTDDYSNVAGALRWGALW